MSFWQKFVKKSAGDTTTAATPAREAQWQASPRPATGFDGNAAMLYGSEYALRTVTGFIARNIASLPFKAYTQENGDRVEVDDDMPLARLLRRPSLIAGQSRYQLFASLLLDQLLTGGMCAIVTKTGGDYHLRRIRPANYSLHENGNGEADRLETTIDGHTNTLRLPNAAVMLSYGYEPDTAGVPATLRGLLDEARVLADYRRQIARNGGRINSYIYRPKDAPEWDEGARERFIRGWKEYVSDGAYAGAWPLFEDGMEIRTADAFKPVDVDDLNARDRINIAVCNAYHVSPENIGFRSGTNSNISAYKEQLWAIELMPYIIQFEQALNGVLPAITGQPDAWIEANVDAKLRGTFAEQYQALSTATGRPFMTTNEARKLLNRPQMPGGDQLITPLNVSEGGQPSPQDGGRTQQAQEGTIR